MNIKKILPIIKSHFNTGNIKVINDNLYDHGTILIKVDTIYYKVENFDSLYNQHEDIITSPDGMCADIYIDPWIEAVEDVHTNREFISTLYDSLNKEEKRELDKVLNQTGNLHKVTGKQKHFPALSDIPTEIDETLYKQIYGSKTAYDFWNTIYEYSQDNYDVDNDTSIFGKAVICALLIYDKTEIIKDYTENVIALGDELLNELITGNFETLFTENDEEIFLYSVDYTENDDE